MNHQLLLTNQPTNQSISKMVSTTRFNKNQKIKTNKTIRYKDLCNLDFSQFMHKFIKHLNEMLKSEIKLKIEN